jgi:hypothetical protein
MSRFAPVVCCAWHTDSLDFLALPGELEPHTLDWFKTLVRSAMGEPERLRERNRWLLASKGAHTLVGVVSESRHLAPSSGTEEYGSGAVGGDLPVFAGYVFEGSCPYMQNSLEPGTPGAELFSGLWRHHAGMDGSQASSPRGEDGSEPFIEGLPPGLMSVDLPAAGETLRRELQRAADSNAVCVAPVAQERQVWESAFCAPAPFALCLGLPGLRYAAASAFNIVTVEGASEWQQLDREGMEGAAAQPGPGPADDPMVLHPGSPAGGAGSPPGTGRARQRSSIPLGMIVGGVAVIIGIAVFSLLRGRGGGR